MSSNKTQIVQKNNKLVTIKKSCDYSHKHCIEICTVANQLINLVDQEYFEDFFEMITKSNIYNCCLYQYSKNVNVIKEFIIKCSQFLIIPSWDHIIQVLSDEQLCKIINNQKEIIPELIDNFITIDILNQLQPTKINFINGLIQKQLKIKSFEYIIMSMKIGQFSKYIGKMSKGINSNAVDNVIIKFIENNKEQLKLKSHKEIGIKIINNFINKPQIIKYVYEIVSNLLTIEQKIEIFNKSISLYNKDLILLMLENNDIIPDSSTVSKLIEKCYVGPNGSEHSKQIADIIDLLCEYGLVITKNIIIELIDHGCYVNNLEKHGIEVDNDIIEECANHSFYPYKFDIKPSTNILIKECSKRDNLNTIKKLKEFGGIYTTECLENACSLNNNGKVIKYLINECNVKVSNTCLEKFKEVYKLEALDVLMKQYISNNPSSVKLDSNQNKSQTLELDPNSTMDVKPRDIIIDKNNNDVEYKIKSKVRIFFDLKKKQMKYLELYEIVLKYLITNKLVIGNYFIINEKMSILLKINEYVVMNIDQLHNILTYFVDNIE